jgi:hypothetical protein
MVSRTRDPAPVPNRRTLPTRSHSGRPGAHRHSSAALLLATPRAASAEWRSSLGVLRAEWRTRSALADPDRPRLDVVCGTLGSRLGAALLWATSWGAWATAGVARPYAMLVVVSLAFVRLAIGVLDRRGRPSIPQALLLVRRLGGRLPHALSVLLVVGRGARGSRARLADEERGRLWPLAPILLAGFVAFVLIDPMFAQSVSRDRERRRSQFTFGDLLPRLRLFRIRSRGLARPPFGSMPFLLLAGALLAWLLRGRRRSGHSRDCATHRESLRALSPTSEARARHRQITFTGAPGSALSRARDARPHAAGGPLQRSPVASCSRCSPWARFAASASIVRRQPVLGDRRVLLTYSSAVRSDQDQDRVRALAGVWHTLAEGARRGRRPWRSAESFPRTMLRVPRTRTCGSSVPRPTSTR